MNEGGTSGDHCTVARRKYVYYVEKSQSGVPRHSNSQATSGSSATRSGRTVIVVDAGMGGMSAAIVAATGHDEEPGRGSNMSVRKFRSDGLHPISPNVAPVETSPFHGLRLRLLNTGIATAGLRTGEAGRALRSDGTEIGALHAIGEAASHVAAGLGYKSGYSLSRAMTYGRIAALDIAEREQR